MTNTKVGYKMSFFDRINDKIMCDCQRFQIGFLKTDIE